MSTLQRCSSSRPCLAVLAYPRRRRLHCHRRVAAFTPCHCRCGSMSCCDSALASSRRVVVILLVLLVLSSSMSSRHRPCCQSASRRCRVVVGFESLSCRCLRWERKRGRGRGRGRRLTPSSRRLRLVVGVGVASSHWRRRHCRRRVVICAGRLRGRDGDGSSTTSLSLRCCCCRRCLTSSSCRRVGGEGEEEDDSEDAVYSPSLSLSCRPCHPSRLPIQSPRPRLCTLVACALSTVVAAVVRVASQRHAVSECSI
jgi:hypothetical protein